MSELRRLAQATSGYEDRRHRGLSVVTKALGIGLDELCPSVDWNSLAVASYLESRPLCLYLEEAFVEYRRHLEATYRNNGALFASDFASCGHDIWQAIEIAEKTAIQIEEHKMEEMTPDEADIRHLHQWYLEIVEQAYDSLLSLPVYRLLTDKGKQGVLKQPRNIAEAIRSFGWYTSHWYYNPIMRNGIAHEYRLIPKTAVSLASIEYVDLKGNTETLFLTDIPREVYGLVDKCLGYAFALRLFLLQHANTSGVPRILQPTPKNQASRTRYFPRFASTQFLTVESIHPEEVDSKLQVRIECTDGTTTEEEQLAELISLLTSAQTWFPEGDHFLVGLRSENPMSFARLDAEVLANWKAGKLTDQGFLESFDPLFLWPKNRKTKGARAAQPKPPTPKQPTTHRDANQPPHPITVLSLTDISHNVVRRYRGDFVLDADTQEQVRALLPSLTNWIKNQRIHHSPQSKQRWRNTPPSYVAGFLYSREKRERDRGAIPTSKFYIGQFEWRHTNTDPSNLPLPIQGGHDLGQSLVYEPSPNWPPPNRFIPR